MMKILGFLLVLFTNYSSAQGIFGGGKGDGFDSKRIFVSPSAYERPKHPWNTCQATINTNSIIVRLENAPSPAVEVNFVSLEGKVNSLDFEIESFSQAINISKSTLLFPGFIYVRQNGKICYVKVVE